jgi:hypothetical protein
VPPRHHKFYWLIADGDKKRNNRPFQVRDGLAGDQITEALRCQGFLPGEDFLNFPPPPGHQGDRIAKIDTSMCRKSDVISSFTRIPRSDLEQGARKKVPRGFTDLEEEIMDEWLPYVPSVSRLVVQLHERLHDKLPPGYENRRRMSLYEAEGAPYNELSACDGSAARAYSGVEHRTPVFKLRVGKMQKRNVGYLGTWALDGNTNLIWSRLLRTRHPELLSKPGFVMAELVGGHTPGRPLDLRWVLDWRVEILIDEPLPGAPKPRRLGPQAGASL